MIGTTQPAVALDRVTVRRRGHKVLDEVSLTVEAGASMAVGGANGSGKTTLLRLLANLYRPDGGRRIGPPRAAYVPAALTPPPLSAERWIRSVPRPGRGDPATAVALAIEFGFDAPSSTSCRELSFGNLRKLLLAEALSSALPLIVIDEASSGLDDRGASVLKATIAERCGGGTAVVVADQGLGPTVPVDRFVVVGRGEVVEWDPATAAEPVAEYATISLSGPTDHLEALLQAAADLGYAQLSEDVTT